MFICQALVNLGGWRLYHLLGKTLPWLYFLPEALPPPQRAFREVLEPLHLGTQLSIPLQALEEALEFSSDFLH